MKLTANRDANIFRVRSYRLSSWFASKNIYCGTITLLVYFCHLEFFVIFVFCRNIYVLSAKFHQFTPTRSSVVCLFGDATGLRQRGKHISLPVARRHTHSLKARHVNMHTGMLSASARNDQSAHALSTSQTHDWFSDVLTGGLILGLCISYAPQVRFLFRRASLRKVDVFRS